MAEQENSPSTLQNLWNRRFFQYLGTYLGLSFGLIQFMDFLVNRYNLDGNLVDKLFIFLLALLPAVIVFIYNHGRPGHDSWKPFEKVFIPASLVVAFSLAMLMFNDGSVRAATEEISIATVDGKEETRVVPKVEFTKRFVIFPFEDLDEKSGEEWMSGAMAHLVVKDMEQFMMNYVISPLGMRRIYTSYNTEFLEELPFATQLKIAQDFYTDYFIDGQFSREEDKIRLKGEVYDSRTGKLFFEKEFIGPDIFEVVDRFSRAINEQLFPKDNLPRETIVDLPASNLITEDMDALKDYIEGVILFRSDIQQTDKAIGKLQRALEKDQRCAACYSILSEMYFAASDEEKMKEASEKAVALAGMLPERQKLMINYFNYNANNELDKSNILLENWIRLYPHDYTPYSLLMNYSLNRRNWSKAEEVGLLALENGHRGSLLYSLATLYINKGEFEKAEQYIDQYYELYPHKSKDKSLLEKIYSGRGELNKAKELYENELVMDPGNVDMLTKLAELENKSGNFTAAKKYLDEALAKSQNVRDSVSTYAALEQHFDRLGQFGEVFRIVELRKSLMGTYTPPSQLKQQFFFNQAYRMVVTRRKATYFNSLEDLKQELPQNAPLFDCIGNYLYHMWADELEGFKQYSDKCLENFIIPLYGKDFGILDQAIRAELEQDFPTAIRYYQEYIDSTGVGNLMMSYGLATVYRKNGQIEEATKQIEEFLRLDPNQPLALLEKARILAAQGQAAEAGKLYEKLMEIWKSADEKYKYYEEAVEFGRELGGDI